MQLTQVVDIKLEQAVLRATGFEVSEFPTESNHGPERLFYSLVMPYLPIRSYSVGRLMPNSAAAGAILPENLRKTV